MREFLMLAHTFNPNKHKIAGWFVSTKYDGERAFWDGGITRGEPTREVPWANLTRKVRPVATGLWTRLGNVIAAPDYWLDKLPRDVFLDGELYSGNLQTLRTIVSRDTPSKEQWKQVQYLVFDMPGSEVFETDKINNINFKREIRGGDIARYLFGLNRHYEPKLSGSAERVIARLMEEYPDLAMAQERLPDSESKARDRLDEIFNEVVNSGGEGLMLRKPKSYWTPRRTDILLKYKPLKDSEAFVVGYVLGQGKHRGALGSLRVLWEGKTFFIGTGFTDEDRELSIDASNYAADNPGELVVTPLGCKFPLGSVITFRYTSVSNDGIPREARYYRKYTHELLS